MKKNLLLLKDFSNLKNKICKYTAFVSKNVYIDKIAHIVNEYNNTNHSTINMKPADVKLSTYIGFSVKNNDKNPKFEVSDHIRISKYKNGFAKGYTPN